MCKWFLESNRYKHFVLAIPCGFLLTVLFGLGLASGMEFKDCHYANGDTPIRKWSWKNWDWLDWTCTVAGSIVGNLLMLLILRLIL